MKWMRSVGVILILIPMLVTGGAYAVWEYACQPIDPVKETIEFQMGDFLWSGSGSLPTDDVIGENHVSLIDRIINHPQHGLNASNSYLNQQIKKRQDGGLGWRNGRDTLGSMAVTQSDELDEIFGLSSDKLQFLIQFVNSNTYYLFTTGVELGERGACNIFGNNTKSGQPTVPLGYPIHPIYRTTVEKINGTWTATETLVGYATSAWYEESRSNANATQIPSFDPDTFTEGNPT